MTNRKKIIDALELCANGCNNEGCSYLDEQNDKGGLTVCRCIDLLARDVIALLKEQDEVIENLKQTAQSMMECICPLKEQEPVKPVRDEETGRIWLCGKCGTYVGFEDNDPNDPNEFDKYCRECGHPVLWEGRRSE